MRIVLGLGVLAFVLGWQWSARRRRRSECQVSEEWIREAAYNREGNFV